jgi:hypothetical protein
MLLGEWGDRSETLLDQVTRNLIRPYLKNWLTKVKRRTIARQFDDWLEVASDFVDRHPEYQRMLLVGDTDGFKTDMDKFTAAMDALLTELGLPKGPYEPDEGSQV